MELPDNPIPAMRTSIRHVDEFGSLVLADLAGYFAHADLWSFATDVLEAVFGTSTPQYDIYNPMLKGFTYTGKIEAPNEMHFYDAHWFTITELGYYRIWNFFESHGWIWTTYPLYPYKS